MSGERVVDTNTDIDQRARADEIQIVDEPSQIDADGVAAMKEQLAALEKRDREREEEMKADRQRLADERRAREAAEARARDADTRARTESETAVRSTEDARLDAFSASLAAKTDQMAGLKGQLRAAIVDNDAEKQADLQATMALLASDIRTLESGKQALEARKQTPDARSREQQPPAAEQPQQSEHERQESFIRDQPPKVQSWLRTHRDRYFNDDSFKAEVASAARHAENILKLRPGSDAFMEYVETEVGTRQPAQREDTRGGERANQPAGRTVEDRESARMVTAPAGGSTIGTTRSNNGEGERVYLSPQEKELARIQGVSEVEWAKHKLAVIKEGGMIGPGRR